MLRRIFCAALVTVFLAGFASAAGEVMFGYKFESGSKQRYRLKLNTEMETMGMEMSQMADISATVTCVSVDKEMHTMNLVFDKVEASNMIGGNMSQDPSAAKMVGKSVTFTVDTHGEVSNINPGPGFDAWPEVQQVVEPTLKNWYVYLPAKAVPVGGTWKRENYHDKSIAGAEYVTNESFKFREVKKEKGGDAAQVDEDVTTQVSGTTQTPMGAYNLAGTGSGKFQFSFNPATGIITRLKGSMETNLDMTPQSGGDAMKTTIANHIERELLE